MHPSAVPAYGRRLIVSRVDELARTAPSSIWASFPPSSDVSQPLRDISWADFANSINRAAFWIKSALGTSDDFQTIAYIGAADVRYFVFLLATIKTGHKLLLTAHTNTTEGHMHLINAMDCDKIFHSEHVDVSPILQQRNSMQSFKIPSLDEILETNRVPYFPYTKTYESAQAEPYVVFHSSGSSGLPKPLVIPQGVICTIDGMHTAAPLGPEKRRDIFTGMISGKCSRLFCAAPSFHAAGVALGLAAPAYFGVTAVFAPPDTSLSAFLLERMIDCGHIDGVAGPSSILEDMTVDSQSLAKLCSLRLVMFMGGPLASSAGNLISKKTYLGSMLGATEFAGVLHHVTDSEDWQYFLINTEGQGIEMREQADGLFELVFIKDPSLDRVQGIFKTFPNLIEYGTKDLYRMHPFKPNHWQLVGRTDDLVVLGNGEKFQPRSLEDALSGHDLIKQALVVGQGRQQAGAFLELRSTPESERQAMDWLEDIFSNVVRRVNEESPSYARLEKSLIALSPPEKPFVRVGKGSISRSATLKLYEQEINQLYGDTGTNGSLETTRLHTKAEVVNLESALMRAFEQTTGLKLSSSDDTFFAAGASSRQISTFALNMRKSSNDPECGSVCKKVSVRLIYEFPTPKKLSEAIVSCSSDIRGTKNVHEAPALEPLKTFDELVKKYTIDMHLPRRQEHRQAVLLTGCSGSLGSHILHGLMGQPSVQIIYCFNRSSPIDPARRQYDLHRARGLSVDFSKIVFVNTDMFLPNLGIDDQPLYRDVLSSVRLIIHSAWPVNFNMPLSSFEPSICTLARLTTLASSSPHTPPLIFISSVAEAQSHPTDAHPLIPERHIASPAHSQPGYGEAKNAGTQILEHAAKDWGVHSSVVRVGQVAGPVRRREGMWPQGEWVPRLVAGSGLMGVVPGDLGAFERIDWTPVDVTAEILVEMALGRRARRGQTPHVEYAHVVSPRSCRWGDLVPAVREYFGREKIAAVSLEEWVQRLEASASEGEGENPAIDLLSFFEYMAQVTQAGKIAPVFATEGSVKLSRALQETGCVTKEMMGLWLEQWGF